MFSLFRRDKTVNRKAFRRSASFVALSAALLGTLTAAPASAVGPWTITLAKVGGGASTYTADSTSVSNGGSTVLRATAASGYVFVSWGCTGGITATLSSTSSPTPTLSLVDNNLTCTATFATAYTVTVNALTGGSASGTPNPVTSGNNITLTATPSAGYAFDRWICSGGGSADYVAPALNTDAVSTFGPITAAATCTATFLRVVYSVTIAGATGGSAVSSSGLVDSGGSVTLTATASAGYVFTGWACTAGTLSSASSNPTTLSSITANAICTPSFAVGLPITVTAGTGGTAVSSVAAVASGGSATLTATPAAGYSFLSWTCTSTPASSFTLTSTATNPATLSAITAAVSCVANFLATSYSITYSGNGNTGGTVPATGTYNFGGTAYTILGNTGALARTGFTFDGWNTSADGTGTTYAIGSTYATTQNLVLYAKWSNAAYTITFSGNGNTSGTAPTAGSYLVGGAAYVIPSNTGSLAKTGYTFAGWNTLADGSGVNYPAGTVYTTAGSLTLYAKWTANAYAITYDGNGSTGGAVPATGAISVITPSYTIATNSGSLVRAGYTFAGWNTATDGSGTAYSAGTSYTTLANLTLYARWTANTYSITYNSNGATDGLAPISATFTSGTTGHVVSDNYGLLDRTGFVFRGWNTQADGKGTNVAVGSLLKPTADTVLYAKWVALIPGKTITLSFAPGSSMLTSTAKFALESLAVYAAAKGLKNISITGYAVASDSRNATTRARIATARATRALNYLLSLDPALNVTTARSSVAKGRVAVVALKSGVAS